MPSCVTAPRVPFDPYRLRCERLAGELASRALIARHVLAFVAAFAGDVDTCEAAMAGHVTCAPGETAALAAERQVRALAGDAESQTMQLTGAHPRGGDVLCEVLADEFLLDDYLRIRAVEQHHAFGDTATVAEADAKAERLRTVAEEAQARAEFFVRLCRDDQKLCRCGQDYGRHRRDASRAAWEPRDAGVCVRFTDVDLLPVAGVPRDLLPAAIGSWAGRHDIAVTAADVADGVRLLEAIRAESRDVLGATAFAAVAAALDWGRATAHP